MNSQSSMKVLFALSCTLILHAASMGTGALGAEGEAGVVNSFKLTLVSQMTMQGGPKDIGIRANTELIYSWRRNDRERRLILTSMAVRAEQDEASMMNTFMDRERFINIAQGKTNYISVSNAPVRLKRVLEESFGVPICVIHVDEAGRELSRKMIAGEGAKDLVDNGAIANALLFHPPFPFGKTEWSVDTEVSVGSGGYVKGKLLYRNLSGGGRVQTCKVSGTLANESFKGAGSPVTMRKSRYVVRGEQAFDAVVGEWVSGGLTMDVSNEMEVGEKFAGTSKGTIQAKFVRLSEKK